MRVIILQIKKTALDWTVFFYDWNSVVYILSFKFLSCLNYLLFLALAFTPGFATPGFVITILTFFCPRNLFHRHAKIIPIMYPTTKVNSTRRIPFPRVAGVRMYTGWRKCSQNIRSRNFCIVVGMIAITTAQIKCINERKHPKTNPALNLLSMDIM